MAWQDLRTNARWTNTIHSVERRDEQATDGEMNGDVGPEAPCLHLRSTR
jgi:hypothetical protein